MKLSLSHKELQQYVMRLVHTYLPDGRISSTTFPLGAFDEALERTEHCFTKINRKYYSLDGNAVFDHLNADHMASFIYFLANTIWRKTADSDLSVRLSYLNKIMHGLDLFYTVPLPDIFLLVHPVGTVLGRAVYGDYLVVYQNCTVGAVTDVYPTFGTGTILYSRSSVLGQCHVGDNVVFAANAQVIDIDIPSDTVVVGSYPEHRFVQNRQTVRQRCFDGGSQHLEGAAE